MSLSDIDTGTMPLAESSGNRIFTKRSFYISLLVPGEETRFFDLNPEGALTIGRSHECDIVISSNSVSRKHALITVKGVQVLLEGDPVVREDLPRVLGAHPTPLHLRSLG